MALLNTDFWAYGNAGIPSGALRFQTDFWAYGNIGLGVVPKRLNYTGWGTPVAEPGWWRDWHPTDFWSYGNVTG